MSNPYWRGMVKDAIGCDDNYADILLKFQYQITLTLYLMLHNANLSRQLVRHPCQKLRFESFFGIYEV